MFVKNADKSDDDYGDSDKWMFTKDKSVYTKNGRDSIARRNSIEGGYFAVYREDSIEGKSGITNPYHPERPGRVGLHIDKEHSGTVWIVRTPCSCQGTIT